MVVTPPAIEVVEAGTSTMICVGSVPSSASFALHAEGPPPGATQTPPSHEYPLGQLPEHVMQSPSEAR